MITIVYVLINLYIPLKIQNICLTMKWKSDVLYQINELKGVNLLMKNAAEEQRGVQLLKVARLD